MLHLAGSLQRTPFSLNRLILPLRGAQVLYALSLKDQFRSPRSVIIEPTVDRPDFQWAQHERNRDRSRPARADRSGVRPISGAARAELLLGDISQLQSGDEAADWVHKNLAAKNALIDADADLVEAGFREKLATIELASDARHEEPQSAPAEDSASQLERPFLAPTDDAAAAPIILPSSPNARRRRVVGKTIRLRDKEHCKFVASQPCVVCGRTPSEAHHIRFAQPHALGRKVSDEYTVPVCRLHHRDLHGYGDEASWWAGGQHRPSAYRTRTVAAIALNASSFRACRDSRPRTAHTRAAHQRPRVDASRQS